MQARYVQAALPFQSLVEPSVITRPSNSIGAEDQAFHSWYRFVLSFPPHLVRDYIRDFGLDEKSVVLDPFCGTGTTLVEAKLHRIRAVGLEANPFPHFASRVKTNWEMNPHDLLAFAGRVSSQAYAELARQGIDDFTLTHSPPAEMRTLDEQAMRLLIKNSISPLPLHKTLVLLDQINRFRETPAHKYGILALGSALVSQIGNLRFGPEIGVGKIKQDVPVIAAWLHEIKKMAKDLASVYAQDYPEAAVFLADAREANQVLERNTIDAVITSPPYPNEKDYTRTTRLESVVLGFIQDLPRLREYKKMLIRSNTRGVYKSDHDDQWIADIPRVQRLAAAIESRRVELGKTSGFEKLYARVTRQYFGGMARHLATLTRVLRPGARLAYVVGDQASYLRVMIRTGQILAEIAERQGYRVERIDLFRTRFATATRSELREEVVVLRWPG